MRTAMHSRERRVGGWAGPTTAPKPAGALLPFDNAAALPITGRPGAVHEAVINISPDGPFTAMGLSYGFEQERGAGLGAFLDPNQPALPPGSLTLGMFPVDALMEGLRVGPTYLPIVFETRIGPDGLELTGGFSPTPVGPGVLNATPVFERLSAERPLEFFFTIIDTASGREFQAEPAFSLASLGDATGRRPFRYLAAPVHFGARSSIRIQVEERTEGVRGTLFLNLFGYQATACATVTPGPPLAPGDRRIIPFDYVAKISLTGREGNRLEDEIPINAEGGFFATHLAYGLQADDPQVSVSFQGAPPNPVDLGKIRLDQLPPAALVDGFRIAPGFIRLAVDSGGSLNSALPPTLVNRIFESLNQPESVSFRYSLFDSGAGRDLQNQPLNNVAGLGSASGERPFKRFATPLHLSPRSTVRVSVDEHFGRGELFLVLQGYKLLEGPASGGRA